VELSADGIDLQSHYFSTTTCRSSFHSRLLDSYKDKPEFPSIQKDVAKDIAEMVFVTEETKTRCCEAYRKSSTLEMKVCGTCGVRDPEDTYTLTTIDNLRPDHWVIIPSHDSDALLSKPLIELLIPSAETPSGFRPVGVPQRSFYNMYSTNNDENFLHLVPEAVFQDSSGSNVIQVCSKCYKAWPPPSDSLKTPKPAPKNSIAAKGDFGRQNFLLELGILSPSDLEMIILAKSRMHSVVFKIVSNGRMHLTGHTMIIPHHLFVNGQEISLDSLSAEAIRAALRGVHVRFVGPKQYATTLEKMALRVEGLLLRPEVLFNYSTMLHILSGGPTPPPIATIQEWLEEQATKDAMPHCNVGHIEDDSVEKAAAPSDVNNVRQKPIDPQDPDNHLSMLTTLPPLLTTTSINLLT
jgi:hypothetical protein